MERAPWGVYRDAGGEWRAASSQAHAIALARHRLDNYRSLRTVQLMFDNPCRCNGSGVIDAGGEPIPCPDCADREAIAALLSRASRLGN